MTLHATDHAPTSGHAPVAAGSGAAAGTTSKVMLSLAALGTAGSLAAVGTHASFTASINESQTISSGIVQLVLGASGAVTNRLDVTASALAPGDSFQRAVTVMNTGNETFGTYTFGAQATTSSMLDTDVTHGLQYVLHKCSQQWTETGVSPFFAYTCGGTTTTMLASRPIIGGGLPLTGMASAAPGGTDHLRVTVTLPVTADNSFQNRTSTILYSFNAGT